MHHPCRFGNYSLIVIAFLMVSLDGSAQVRARPNAAAGAAAASNPVLIRELTGFGKRGLVQTPGYTTTISPGRAVAGVWAEMLVQFDSDPEWIDEISFQYYVLLHDRKTKEFMFLKGLVAHVDVARGRGHLSAMYVRPSVLVRYGEVVAVAVEAVIKGVTVGVKTDGKLPQGQALPEDWWKTTKLVPRDGYLLNRSQTPFAFVNYDDYAVIK